MMKVAIVLALLAVSAMAYTEKEYRTAFLKFVKENNKKYSAAEFTSRYATFKSNMDFVQTWNANPEAHRVAINQFADLSTAEYSRIYLGTRINRVPGEYVAARNESAPTSVDWRTKGAVTPIKNQEQCGSCWAFSAVGSSEGAHFFATNKLVSLSEQNLVDCSDAEGNQGCNGGLMDQAFNYIIKNNGIDTEASYPYTAADGTCKFSAANVGATLKSFDDVQSGSETDLVNKIVEGPTSVAIDASHQSFQLYHTGVYYEPACSAEQLDHGVLAVGYAAEGNKEYYIVKNSWGTSWGQDGYIWMSKNRNNNCGIATAASIPKA